MIIKLGLLVSASIAAYAIHHICIRRWREPIKASEMDDASRRQTSDEDNEHNFMHPTHGLKEVVGEEEVKVISGIINQPFSNLADIEDEISEFESLLSGEIDYASPSDKYIKVREFKAERDGVYEKEMSNTATELERLRSRVQDLQEREGKLEAELLQYYGLKEQELDIDDLQKQLKIKSVEIDMLNFTINSLQAERKKLQAEVAEGVLARKELEIARNKMKEMQRQIQLDANQTKVQLLLLKQQVIGLQVKEEEAMKNDSEVEKKLKSVKDLEVEVVELKRMNKELQYEKREVVVKLDAAEAKIKTLSNVSQNDMVASAHEEIDSLRNANEDLQKQVEGLQMNRFSEVEELVYLRWVNACLRHELRNYPTNEGKLSARGLSKHVSPKSQVKAKQLMLEYEGSELGQGDMDLHRNLSQRSYSFSEYSDSVSIDSYTSKYSSLSKTSNLIRKLKKWGKNKDDSGILSSSVRSEGGSPRRSSMSVRPRVTLEALMLRNAGDSVAIISFGTGEQDVTLSPETPRPLADSLNTVASSSQLMPKSVEGVHTHSLERERRLKEKSDQARAARFGDASGFKRDSSTTFPQKLALRVPPPPPKPAVGAPAESQSSNLTGIAGAPPPPPPPQARIKTGGSGEKVHRAPEVEEKKDSSPMDSSDSSALDDARSNMFGEIRNKPSFHIAVKDDVETQGAQFLATEVREASFVHVDELVEFVNWMDEELYFLVDEGADLKSSDWPESKADALREAAFEYQSLVNLEKQMTSFVDDPSLPCEAALGKMYMLLEKVEQSVLPLLCNRDIAISRYKEFGVPVDWLLDSALIDKIKLSSVKLATNYMKRVSSELDSLEGPEKEPKREFIALQGVRFAFRVHQFADGFDEDSMKVFEELRIRISAHNKQQT